MKIQDHSEFPKLNSFFIILGMFCLSVVFSGCAGPRVRVDDGQVEAPMREATGVNTEQVRQAAGKKELGFWDAYALSVERTERLASRYENLEQAKAETQQAIGAYVPHVSLNANRGFWGAGTSSGVSLALHATQPILTGLNEVSALKGASALKSQRKEELRFDAQRLLLDVARAYYGTLQLLESQKTEQSSRDLAVKMLKEERVFRDQGRIRMSDVLSSETQLALSEAELTTIQDQLEQSREQLSFLCEVPPDQLLAAEDPASFPVDATPLDQLLKAAETRSDVVAARENLKVVKAQLLAAEGGYIPVLSAQGDYYLQKQGNNSSSPKWDAYLSASLPIFSGGQTEGKVREAKSRVRQAELLVRQTLRAAREEIRQAAAAYRNAVKEDEAYQTALAAAEKSHKAQEGDYRLRLTNVVEYLQSLNDLEQARLNAAKSKYQWRIQRIWLGVATGQWPKTGELPSGTQK